MAKPSLTESWGQLTAIIKVIDQHWKYTKTNSPNYYTLAGNVETALKGDHLGEVVDFLRTSRRTLSDFYLSAKPAILKVLRSILNDGYNIPSQNLQEDELFDKLQEAMQNATPDTILSRGITYASISAGGSNNSNGTIYRNTTDRYGYDIESGYVGPTIAEVIRDNSSSNVELGTETLLIRGNDDQKIDEIDLGSASPNSVQASFKISGKTNSSANLLRNGSFDDIEGVAHGAVLTKTSQGGWTVDTPTNVKKETSEIFRFTNGTERNAVPTGVAIRFTGDVVVSQYLKEQGIKLTDDKKASYFLICRYRRKSSCDGTLTLRLGSQTVTKNIATATNDVWEDLILGTDEKGYFEIFNEDWIDTSTTPNIPRGIMARIALSSHTTGELIIDEVILAKGVLFEGVSYFPVSGSNTGATSGDNLNGDSWTWADSDAATGRNQTVIARLFNRHLPHVSSSPEYADA